MAAPATSNKYRILLVIRWPVGGIRSFVRYVYNKFPSSQYEFTILAPDTQGLKSMIKELTQHDVSYISVKEDCSVWSLFVTILKTVLWGRFHLIHSHGFSAGLCSAVPARLRKTSHIMTCHEVLLKTQFEGPYGQLKLALVRMLLPTVDVIHCVSHDGLINLREYIPQIKKAIVIRNGVEVSEFTTSEKRNLRRELDLPEDVFLIGFLGRFMSPKGFVYLVEAVDLLAQQKDLPKRPVVVAVGEGGFIREERERIKAKGLEQYFVFLPFTHNVGGTLKGLDVVAMPSLWEAYGLVAAEAMVAGVPVIGTDCIGLREVLRDTPSRMVRAADSVSLAKALLHEMKNPSRKRTEEFSAEAARRFDVKRQVKALERVLWQLSSRSDMSIVLQSTSEQR